MTCSSCGCVNPPHARYCDNCGKALHAQAHRPVPAYSSAAPMARERRTNGMAVASLVLGIVWLYGIGSILALVFGYVGRSQIDESGGAEGGRGLATAGIVLGWVGVGLLLYWLLVVGTVIRSIDA